MILQFIFRHATGEDHAVLNTCLLREGLQPLHVVAAAHNEVGRLGHDGLQHRQASNDAVMALVGLRRREPPDGENRLAPL